LFESLEISADDLAAVRWGNAARFLNIDQT
jgi:hypothetical protein